MNIRAFTDADYPRLVEIGNNVFPEAKFSEQELRYMDDSLDPTRFFKYRAAVEDASGVMVGYGDFQHMRDQFHPDKYSLELAINPPSRRQGLGSALHDHLMYLLQQRQAVQVRTFTKESESESNQFARNRGYVEARREWQSRLDVNAFDPAPFRGAMERVTNEGIELTTLTSERAANPNALHDLYTLDQIVRRDVPDIDPYTDATYDDFIKNVIEPPYAIPEGYLIAKHGDRYVGSARLYTSEEDPGVLHQGITGVIPEYRGKGIAMALKLRTVECARGLGKDEIRTWNDTMNRPMLRINEALGFVKEPAEIIYVKDLTTG